MSFTVIDSFLKDFICHVCPSKEAMPDIIIPQYNNPVTDHLLCKIPMLYDLLTLSLACLS